MDRRLFLQNVAGTVVAASLPSAGIGADLARPDKKMIGIQVGAVSFADEGVSKVLDECQRSASITTLFVATFTYGRGIAGRQIPGQPLPDHGSQKYDSDTFFGGSYTKVNPKYYTNTAFRDFRAPDLGSFDVLEQVIPEAKKRGMRTICWYEDVFRRGLPNIEKLQEVELSGKRAATLCFNNPDYLSWLQDMAEDWSRSYDIDGIMWGSERQGALSNVLGASHADPQPSTATCFCEFCYAKARRQGINPERARQGFLELEKLVLASRKGVHPVDGSYVEFWRLMLRYPELLAWESLWTSSLREAQKAIYARVKAVNSTLGVGWHIRHNNSFNPIYRAEQDLAEMAPYSDFLKIVMYHNCAGERMADYINSVGTSYFSDIPKQELLEFHYRVMDFGNEPALKDLPPEGFSADYVYRETMRAKQALKSSKTKLWPGIDIDIPTERGNSKCTPAGTKAAVLAAFRGGADGVILSRKYSEMKLENLRAAGAALKGLGLS
jgi:hypothetical protein